MNPSVSELEVTENDITITTTYSNGKSIAKFIALSNVDYVDFTFYAPSVPRSLKMLATIINLLPVRFTRTQPVYTTILCLMALATVLLISARTRKDASALVLSIVLTFMAIIFNRKSFVKLHTT